MMNISLSTSALALAALCVFLVPPVGAQTQRPSKIAVGIDNKPFIPLFARVDQGPEWVAVDMCDKPLYPKASLRREETGPVVLRFKISATGAILDSMVSRSSGFRDLDKAALVGLNTCKFRPATINGRAVPGYAHAPYSFKLD